jgi:hypothetical protein
LEVLGTEVALPRRLQNHAKLSTYVDRDVLLGLRAEDLSTDPAWLNITDPAAFRVQVEMAVLEAQAVPEAQLEQA